MLCNYYYECRPNAHLQHGEGGDYSMQYAVNSSEFSAPVAPKATWQRRKIGVRRRLGRVPDSKM